MIETELRQQSKTSHSPTNYRFWNQFNYTLGVLQESLQQILPGSGVPGYGPSDFALARYHIPSGTPVMMYADWKPGSIHVLAPEQFEPLPWVPMEDSSFGRCPFAGPC